MCEFKIFLLFSSSGTISNINLLAEDLQTLKLKANVSVGLFGVKISGLSHQAKDVQEAGRIFYF